VSGLHPSHKTRFSFGASSFDEICEKCGATDQVPGGWGRLAFPCPKASAVDELAEIVRNDKENPDAGLGD